MAEQRKVLVLTQTVGSNNSSDIKV